MSFHDYRSLGLLALVACPSLCGSWAIAQRGPLTGSPQEELRSAPQSPGEEGASGGELSGELEGPPDLAFQKYVDLRLIRRGLAQQDPRLLTDAALEIAEGERVLLRRHDALSADRLLRSASNLAIAAKDRRAIDRLLLAAERLGNQQLAARLEAAQKLTARSRAREPTEAALVGLQDSEAIDALSRAVRQLEKQTPVGTQGGDEELVEPTEHAAKALSAEGAVLYRAYLAKIRRCAGTGNRGKLLMLRENVQTLTQLGDGLRRELERRIEQALKGLSAGE